MFLKYLSDKCKPLFLDLCIFAANSNGEFSDEEKEAIVSLASEMEISPKFENCFDNFDKLILELNKNAVDHDKDIICFEALGVLCSDGIIDEKEKAFEIELMSKLGCDLNKYDEMASLLLEFYDLSLRIGQCITK